MSTAPDERQDTTAALHAVPPGSATPRRDSLPRALIREARPKQWLKNVLVLAAPGAAGVLHQPEPLVQALVAVVAFCLAASGVYYLNDCADIASDRRHPAKRHRPVAAGDIPVRLAVAVGVGLLLAGLGVAALASWPLALVVAAYLAVTTAYTIWLKHIAVVDLLGVAAGFVLRALAGAVAVGVPVSRWFFTVATLGSLFMIAGKREGELATLTSEAPGVRRTLGVYSASYLAYLRATTSGAALVAYCLWAFERDAISGSSFPIMLLTVVPFSLGILRYALLLDAGKGAAPEELVLSDRPLQVFGGLWVALIAVGVYLP